MASEITIPKSSGYHGTITKWYKAIGDPIRKGEILFEITSSVGPEKFLSTSSGVLTSIIRFEGDAVTGGNVLGQISDCPDRIESDKNESNVSGNHLKHEPIESKSEDETIFEDVSLDKLMDYIGLFDLTQALADVQSHYVRETQERFALRKIKNGKPTKTFTSHQNVIRAMPSARIFAKNNGINLIDLVNCGVRGCITKRDVARFIEQRRIFEKQQKEKRDADFSEHLALYNNAEPDEIPIPVALDKESDENASDFVSESEKNDRVSFAESDDYPTSKDDFSSDETDNSGSREKRVKVSHLAQNIAQKNQIELDNGVSGSGAHGRILKSDLTNQVADDNLTKKSKTSDTRQNVDISTELNNNTNNSQNVIENNSKKSTGIPSYTLDLVAELSENDKTNIDEQILLNDFLVDEFKSQLSVPGGYRYHDFSENTEVAVLTKDIDITFLKRFRKSFGKSFEAETGMRCASTDLWLVALSKAFCEVSTKKEDVNIALLLKNNKFIVTPVIKSVDHTELGKVVKSRIDFIEGVKCNRYDKSTYFDGDIAFFNLSPFEIESLAFPITKSGCPVITTGGPKDKAYGLTKKTVVTLSITVLPDWISFGAALVKAVEAYIAEPDLIFK